MERADVRVLTLRTTGHGRDAPALVRPDLLLLRRGRVDQIVRRTNSLAVAQ
jgi:hypothetical protein